VYSRTHNTCYTYIVPKRNLTLALDEELLLEARVVAARQHTSVNEMVRQHLESVVGKKQERLAAWDRVRPLLENPRFEVGDGFPSRDQLHER